MKSSNMTWSLIVFFILLFGTAPLGYAAATVIVSPTGNGQVNVQGDGFAGVEGVQIDIQYDKTALTNPRVEQGSLISGMLMVLHNEPGLLHYAGTYAFPKTTSTASGTIAVISFDTLGNSPANLSGAATLKDPNGNVLQVLPFAVQITGSNTSTLTNTTTTDGANNGANTGSGTGTGTTVTSSGPVPPSATGNAIPVALGSVSMPDAGTPAVAKTKDETPHPISEPEKIEKQTSDAVAKEIASPTSEAALQSATQEKSAVFNKSVLERFREYQGEQSPKNLIALFKSVMAGNTQEPPLALSDGNTIVKVFVDLPATGKVAPNFALKEAKLVSLKRTSDSAWVVEVLPNRGTFEAAVIVLQDDKTVNLPLTVAPPLSTDSKIGKGGVLTEADFISFLKDRGTKKAPRFDLNGDGKRDYIDDYIFTANFLAKTDAGKPAADKKTQGTK
jgi:hypothetical protein